MTDAPTGALIFIVDDDPEIGELVTALLTPLGIRIVPLTDPTAVFDLALQQRPALILLDLIMPRLDGHAVARRLREDRRTAAIPIVFLTTERASSYRHGEPGARGLGASAEAVYAGDPPGRRGGGAGAMSAGGPGRGDGPTGAEARAGST